MDRMSKLGDLLRQNRNRKKLSLEQVGKAIGVSRSAVDQWELGTTQPKGARVSVVISFLNIDPVDYMVAQSDDSMGKLGKLAGAAERLGQPTPVRRDRSLSEILMEDIYNPTEMPEGSPEERAVFTLARYLRKKASEGG